MSRVFVFQVQRACSRYCQGVLRPHQPWNPTGQIHTLVGVFLLKSVASTSVFSSVHRRPREEDVCPKPSLRQTPCTDVGRNAGQHHLHPRWAREALVSRQRNVFTAGSQYLCTLSTLNEAHVPLHPLLLCSFLITGFLSVAFIYLFCCCCVLM